MVRMLYNCPVTCSEERNCVDNASVFLVKFFILIFNILVQISCLHQQESLTPTSQPSPQMTAILCLLVTIAVMQGMHHHA